MEMNIDLEGRKLVKNEIIEQTPTKVVSVSTYDDGTVLTFYQKAGDVKVECNRDLVVQPDGKTVKIVNR